MRLTRLAMLILPCAIAAAAACSPPASEEQTTNESNVESANDVFAKSEALPVRIAAPFSKLWERFRGGQADPPDPDAGPGYHAPEFSEPGQLFVTVEGAEKALDLRVYVRGESSKNDCPFPKLKIDFTDKEQLKKTPFKGHGKFRLNTHCGPGDASARSQMGRVMNGVGPVREELTYRLIRAAGIPTYRTRVLSIRYDDTAANTQLDTFGMAMESGNDAAQRFQKMDPPLIPADAVYLDPSEARGSTTPENQAEIIVAEAFSGNKDWGGTHNIDSFGAPQAQTMFQIAQDFDLGAIVLGDIARYWKGMAPVTDAQRGLQNATIAAKVKPHQADMEAAYREAEKAAIAAKAIPAADDGTTTDPGFLEAKKRIQQLFALPELNAAAPADAGTDAPNADAAP